MHRFLTILFWLFVVCYVLALIIFAAGMWGADKEPLSGIFLIPLGFPWFLAADLFEGTLQATVAALAPLVNLGLIHLLVRRTAPRPHSTGGL